MATAVQLTPWVLFAIVGFLFLAAVVALFTDDRQLRAANAEIKKLKRAARINAEDLRSARQEAGRRQVERDLARATVRDLLDAQRAGFRWPLPMPVDVDKTLVDDFTAIVARNMWPEWPTNPQVPPS